MIDPQIAEKCATDVPEMRLLVVVRQAHFLGKAIVRRSLEIGLIRQISECRYEPSLDRGKILRSVVDSPYEASYRGKIAKGERLIDGDPAEREPILYRLVYGEARRIARQIRPDDRCV